MEIEQTSVFRFESASLFDNFVTSLGHIVRHNIAKAVNVLISRVIGN